jgi:outer membrane lipoprotein SlyB
MFWAGRKEIAMTLRFSLWICALVGSTLATDVAIAQTGVSYGKITAVKPVSVENAQAQGAGALVGGTLGLISGRGQSGSNRALRAVAGGVAGQQIAKHASSKQAFEYTILMGGKSTTTVVTDEAGMRVGDCVAVERGSYVNLRLVHDRQCAPNAKPTSNASREAAACNAAKDEVLKAKDDEAFDRAERKLRLLCDD